MCHYMFEQWTYFQSGEKRRSCFSLEAVIREENIFLSGNKADFLLRNRCPSLLLSCVVGAFTNTQFRIIPIPRTTIFESHRVAACSVQVSNVRNVALHAQSLCRPSGLPIEFILSKSLQFLLCTICKQLFTIHRCRKMHSWTSYCKSSTLILHQFARSEQGDWRLPFI